MWKSHCECGWTKSYRNPVAARWGWEWHIKSGECQFYNDAVEVAAGRKEESVIDRTKYAGDAILRYNDFKNGQTVTVDWFREIKTQLRDRGVQPALKLSEFEDKYLPLNTTNLDAMIDKFGTDEEKWKGKKIRIRIVDTQLPNGKPAKGVRIE